jgi:uncharacterized membrane protein (UPF0127 family)
MTRFILTLLLILGQPVAAWSQTAQSDLPRVVLQAGMYQLDVQVAATPLQREVGLMYRQSMPTHEGMVFVFEQAQQQCFWMKNTLLPLTAAFVADDGVIVNLADMRPQTTDSHCSDKPVRFVLEMNQGWFAKRNITQGFQLKGPLFKAKNKAQ